MPKLQQVYRQARDCHVENSKRAEKALVDVVEPSQLAGKAKAEAITRMRKEFEAQRVHPPYFPLSRSVDHCVMGNPEDGNAEFHLFQTVEQRDDSIEAQKKAGWTILGHRNRSRIGAKWWARRPGSSMM